MLHKIDMVGLYTSLLGNIPVVCLILLAAASVILGDYAAKAWSVHGHGSYLLLALLGYFFSGFFYIPTLLREGHIVTSVLWVVLSTIGFLVIGLVIFKETLSFPQVLTVVLGCISIVVLAVFDS